ncbi:hypothetical protein SDC9_85272 [bioreactor metagenome]|uniref:HTH tetR-type domain-containing protein n=1 Tax=bioreactor metagenome TaxID=1076179 RepID=A0A644ZCL8_9ZZZZ
MFSENILQKDTRMNSEEYVILQVLTKPTHVSIIIIDTCVEKKGGQLMSTKKEKTRELILDISYTLFAKNGFNKITMKDICDATNMSRGGLYSHFSSTREIFEAILKKINQKDEMNFFEQMEKNIPAIEIINNALVLMEDEMSHPEDSLSLAMYEYSGSVDSNLMEHFNKIGEEKWTALINYGIERGEFHRVNVTEIVNVILYAYQGVRMWSRIIPMTPDIFKSITSHIKNQIMKENANDGISKRKIDTASVE